MKDIVREVIEGIITLAMIIVGLGGIWFIGCAMA